MAYFRWLTLNKVSRRVLQEAPPRMPATEECSPSGCERQHSKIEDIFAIVFACLMFPAILWFIIGFFAAPVSSLMYLYSVSKPA